MSDPTVHQTKQWRTFALVLAVVMMVTSSILTTIVSLLGYERSSKSAEVIARLSAELDIVRNNIGNNSDHIRRIYVEIDRLRTQRSR